MANKSGKNKRKKNRGGKAKTAAASATTTANAAGSGVAQTQSPTARPKKSKSAASKPQKNAKAGIGNLSKRGFIKLGLFVVGGGAIAASLHAYDRKKTLAHDLSVIGQGTPVMVQIHDPGCPTCRRLKGAVKEAMGGVDGVHSRIADITTREGRTFAAKYGVPKTTLLFFDDKGKHRHTITGVQTPTQIQEALQRHLLPGVS